MKIKFDKEMLLFDLKSIVVIIIISLGIWFFATKMPKCSGSSSQYNSDGFNEVTGEYDPQRVIDYYKDLERYR